MRTEIFYTKKVRSNGARVSVLKVLDPEGGPYAIRCEEHGTVVGNMPTQHRAWELYRFPREWCPFCATGESTAQPSPAPKSKPKSKPKAKTEPKVSGTGGLTKEKVKELAHHLMAEHDVAHVPLKFNSRTTRRLGAVAYRRGDGQPVYLELSTHMLRHVSWEQVTDTILHEIAHIIAGPKAGHGTEWKRVAARIGATPQTCTKALPPEAYKYQAECTRCGHVTGFSRMTARWRMEVFTHKGCGGHLRVRK